jgi:DnaJ-class molecular chaperone
MAVHNANSGIVPTDDNIIRYQDLLQRIESKQTSIAYHEQQLVKEKNEKAFLEKWAEELKAHVCSACGGYGKIRTWIYQDESRLDTCSVCQGTGKSNSPIIAAAAENLKEILKENTSESP